MQIRRPLLLALIAAALILRLGVAIGLATDEPDDGRLYTRLAHNVLVHGVYAIEDQPPFHPTYIRVPGYPLFVAAVYRAFGDWNNTAVRAVQAVADTATCGLVAWLALLWAPEHWARHRRRRAALAAFVLAAACPFPLIYPATLLTETLALLLGTAAVCFTTSAAWQQWERQADGPQISNDRENLATRRTAIGRWIVTGLVAGVAALVRPENGLYLAVAAAMLVVGGGRRAWRAPAAGVPTMGRIVTGGLALGLGFAIVLAPWTVRNFRVFGIFQPLNPRTVAMPDEFVPIGYETWLRTWINHPRYIGDVLFALDADPIAPPRCPARPSTAWPSAPASRRCSASTTRRRPTRIPTPSVGGRPGA